MQEIWVDQNIPGGEGLFNPYGKIRLFQGRNLKGEKLSSADALIIRSTTRVSPSLLQHSPVKFVGTATIGTDHIDIPYLKNHNIGFAFAPGCNSNSVSEYIIATLQFSYPEWVG